jgi:KaiC/GvpD/RAD55 family RecA-like ATPase
MGEQGKQSVFHSSEVELMEAIQLIRSRIAETRPMRIVIDSLSELRHLAGDDATYRLNMDALKPYLIEDDRTVVMVDTLSSPDNFALHTLVHGVINLSFTTPGGRPLPPAVADTEDPGREVPGGASRFRGSDRQGCGLPATRAGVEDGAAELQSGSQWYRRA